jgi:hypothetical protein
VGNLQAIPGAAARVAGPELDRTIGLCGLSYIWLRRSGTRKFKERPRRDPMHCRPSVDRASCPSIAQAFQAFFSRRSSGSCASPFHWRDFPVLGTQAAAEAPPGRVLKPQPGNQVRKGTAFDLAPRNCNSERLAPSASPSKAGRHCGLRCLNS